MTYGATKPKLVDLHMHTQSSDGVYSGNEILNMMGEYTGKKIISITDHDSVDEYFKLNLNLLKDNNIILIPGVEFSFSYNGVSRDMLAYNVDINRTKEFLDNLYNKEFKLKKQKEILKKFMDKAIEHEVTFDDNITIMTGNKSEAYGLMLESIRKNPLNLQKYPNFIKGFYRSEFSNPNSSWFVDDTMGTPSLERIIDIIHSLGGKAFLAHPYDYNVDKKQSNQMIIEAINAGVDGLEVDHSSNKNNNREILQNYVNKCNLLQSGGSDFHGEKVKKGIQLFVGNNNVCVDYHNVCSWLDITKAIGYENINIQKKRV